MTLLDELKKLVASVENAKEDFYTTYQKGKCIKNENQTFVQFSFF